MGTVYSANRSSVLLDNNQKIDGLQSLTYRVVTEREDIRAVGSSSRVGVSFGLQSVVGEMVVKSSNPLLDGHLDARSDFQIVAILRPGAEDDPGQKTVTFSGVYVEGKSFALDAGGTGVTTYSFTAAKVREDASEQES